MDFCALSGACLERSAFREGLTRSPHLYCFNTVPDFGIPSHKRITAHLVCQNTIGHCCAFIQALPTATRRATEGHTMTDTRIANIELITEIEELENKIAPSGCATLGDL